MKEYNLVFKNGCYYKSLPIKGNDKVIYYIYKTKTIDGGPIFDGLKYIGKSINDTDRLNNSHEKIQKLSKEIDETKGENIWIAYAILSDEQFNNDDCILEAEACLIFNKKPPLNIQNTDSIVYSDIKVTVSGNCICPSEIGVFEI